MIVTNAIEKKWDREKKSESEDSILNHLNRAKIISVVHNITQSRMRAHGYLYVTVPLCGRFVTTHFFSLAHRKIVWSMFTNCESIIKKGKNKNWKEHNVWLTFACRYQEVSTFGNITIEIQMHNRPCVATAS